MIQVDHVCQRCGCSLATGKWYCDPCLAVLQRHDRWEELADRDEAAEEKRRRR